MLKNIKPKQIAIYLGVLTTFCVVALFYFYPVLKGEKIFQSDIAQFRGMSKELKDFRAINGEEAYWTDTAFGGMPSYQLSTYYPNDYIKKLDKLIRFLPRPADYLFLYFLSFFVLLLVTKVDWKLALIGALAFGFSTYLIIILGVGHNAKAHAIGYMPLVLAGVILLFDHKYLWGFIVTTLAMGLEVSTSHPQMTYYLGFLLVFVGFFYLLGALQEKSIKTLLKPLGFVLISVFLGLLINAQSLLATKEYASNSTRSKSELTINADGSPKEQTTGLNKSYITEYSYGVFETLNLLIPTLTGGGNSENLGMNSNVYQFLSQKVGLRTAKNFSKNAPTYWGDQPIVAAPAYIGAGVIVLFFIGCFLVRGSLKKGLLAAVIFSILMSWGKNFELLTNFFINYVPLYNKFRAVSSIQVIAELCIPFLGVLALKDLFSVKISKEEKLKALKLGGGIALSLIVVFGFIGGLFYSYSSEMDAYYNKQLPGFSGALQADRRAMLFSDAIRSLVLVFSVIGVIWFFIQEKIKQQYTIVVLGLLLLFDTCGVAIRYVNKDDFLPAKKVEKPFVKTDIDKQILQDKGHYRVANLATNFMNDGATSYYHKSIGGYHAAKLRRYQELVDFQLSKNNPEVFNMLNTKYLIIPNQQGDKEVHLNEEVNGNAWFINKIIMVDTPDEEILALSDFNSKEDLIVNTQEFLVNELAKDSLSTISLTSYQPNVLSYQYKSAKSQIAVFSEIYYQPGWNAYLDGKLTSHFRANYVLRAMQVPAGEHKVVFKFEPNVIQQGSKLSLAGYGLFVLILILGVCFKERINNF